MGIGYESGMNWELFWLMFVLALLAGSLYAWGVIHWARQHGFIGRYTTLLIIGGCVLTVVFAMPLIGFNNAALVGVFFIATGTPQVAEELLAAAAAERRERESYDTPAVTAK